MGFFARALDVITPWNRNGEVQRRQQIVATKRRRREEDQNNSRASGGLTNEYQPESIDEPKPQKPVNIFETLNKSVKIGQNNPNTVKEYATPDAQPAPQPGEIVKPNQSFANKIVDQFSANTEADKYRRAQQEVKVQTSRGVDRPTAIKIAKKSMDEPAKDDFRDGLKIGLRSAGGVGSTFLGGLAGVARGAVETPSFFLRAPGLVRFAAQKAAGDKRAEENLANDNGIFANLAKRYDNLVKPVTTTLRDTEGGADIAARNLSPWMSKDVSQATKIYSNLLPLGAILAGANKLSKARGAAKLVEEGADEVLTTTGRATTKIPVRQGIPIEGAIDEGTNIPVNVRTPEKPLGPIIREIGGDAKTVTSNSQAASKAFDARRAKAEAGIEGETGLPDRTIEGITPRTNEGPFNLTPEKVASDRSKIVEDYSKMISGLGEGNGTQLVPDGAGGYIRTSNNVRFGGTKGKKMTKADWIEEAQLQLDSGKAEPSLQKAYDEAANPEVQSLVARGDATPLPEGRPITVKAANSIDVLDQTNVPQGLPEAPGTVRPIVQTSPMARRTEAVAEATPPRTVAQKAVDAEFNNTAEVNSRINNPESSPAVVSPPTGSKSELENMVQSLRENQKSYRGEKKLRKEEFGRRQAEKQRLYEQYRSEGMSGQDAKQAADQALGGAYTKSFGSKPEVSEATINDILDKTKGDQNTQNAFARWFDPNRTESLRDWERTRIRAYIQKELGEDAAQSIDEAIVMAERAGDRSAAGRIADFMTSSIAAGDISAVARQGLSGWLNHPVMSKGAWDDALKALMSADGEKKFAANLANNPNAAFIQEKMGGKWLTLSDIADEARGMDTGNRATSWYVNPSNRHYNTYLDSLRLRQKEAIINKYGGQEGFLKAAQDANPENPEKWMKAWNNVIDRQSGRGSFSNFGSPSVGDVQVLFSARNLASKFQRLTALFDLATLKNNPSAYAYQLKETATQAAALVATLAAVDASGLAEIENGKIKIGNTRIDITGGFSTIYKAGNDLYKSMSGNDDDGYQRSGGTIITDFLRNQLSPILGTAGKILDVDWSEGKDKYGNEVNAGWFVKNAPLPAVVQSVINSVSEGQNPLETARNVALDAVGLNTNTYQSAEDKKGPNSQETKDMLKQFKKEGIGTTDKDIDNYIADGDFDKATRVAEYNVMKLKSNEKSGSSEIKKAEQTLKELTLKKDGVPMTDDGIKAKIENGDWDQAIRGYQYKIERAQKDGESSKKTEDAIRHDIKRAEISRDNSVPPELLSDYRDISLSEWRKMGDPDSDEYDADLYQQLWDIDQLMTKSSVSYKSGEPDENKYSAKTGRGGSGSGGGSGQREIDTKFGKLKGGGPNVQAYDTIEQKSGSVPRIGVVRPNIVHKITSSR